MKRFVSILLMLCLCLGLLACGTSGGATETTEAKATFKAGFGKQIITPDEPVPMASYGDDRDRISTGRFTELEARAVAIQDENGDIMVFAVGDLTWCPAELGPKIMKEVEKKYGVPADHVVLSGTHTHASVSTVLTDFPAVNNYNKKYINGMTNAIGQAIEDLKPAEVYAGSAITENMNFVRRYIMDDGSLIGDNAYGTGEYIVSHESEADSEMQLMKFVREGGNDIVIANFQSHPHLEGKTTNISAQNVGAFRDAVEKEMGIHCLYWQGASGNLNSSSRIEGETRTKDRNEYGKLLAGYVAKEYDNLTKVETGPIKVTTTTFTGKVNKIYNDKVDDAKLVKEYFKAGHTPAETAEYAWQFGINSYYHANRIVNNFQLPETKDMDLTAFSFGEIAGIIVPYEMFDTNGMEVKTGSPFTRTFIISYSYPSYSGYIPSALGYENGGYESDNSTYAPGTGEELVAAYLGMLNELKGK